MPCVVFGLHGDVDGAQIDDAEGGDFDLQLESGERVMVSLKHAILVTEEAVAPSIVQRKPFLDELLDERGIGLGRASGTARVAEVVVREETSSRRSGGDRRRRALVRGTRAVARSRGVRRRIEPAPRAPREDGVTAFSPRACRRTRRTSSSRRPCSCSVEGGAGTGRKCPGQGMPRVKSWDCSDAWWALGLRMARRVAAGHALRPASAAANSALRSRAGARVRSTLHERRLANQPR